MDTLSIPYPLVATKKRKPAFEQFKTKNIMRNEIKNYKAIVAQTATALNDSPLFGPVGIRIVSHPPDRKSRDLSDIIKITIESLRGFLYYDDSQIEHIEIVCGTVCRPDGSLDVSAWKLYEKEKNNEPNP